MLPTECQSFLFTLLSQKSGSCLKADQETEDVRSTVYAHSEYKDVQLVDGTVQSGLDQLENSTQTLGDQMRELDVDLIAKSMSSKQAEVIRKLQAP